MENTEQEITATSSHRKGMVHFVLLHSYLIFLLAVILGTFFDPLYTKRIFSTGVHQVAGFVMLIIGSILIYWAQTSSSNYKQKAVAQYPKSFFELGPYKYLRSPTHFGLFILTLGFATIINSIFGILFVFIAYAITKFFFLKKEEKLLELKYGQAYKDYKKRVKNWV